MNDRFEPRPADADGAYSRAAGNEDPLLELARIVSGRAPVDGGRRRAPLAGMEPANEADLARDLEAELLSDLQASFSMARPQGGRSHDDGRGAAGYRAQPVAAPEDFDFSRLAAAPQPEPAPAAEPSFGFLSLRREAVYQPDFQVEPPAAENPAVEEPADAIADEPPVDADSDPFQALRLDYASDDGVAASETREPILAAPAPELDAEQPTIDGWQPGFDPAEGYQPTEDQLQSLEPAPARRGWRSRQGLSLVAGLFAVILLGGVGVIALRGDDATAGPPPIIAADTTPIRIAAADPAFDPGEANKLIYDRVDPAIGPEVETVLAPAEDPVPDVAGLGPGLPAPRVILRGAPGDDAIGGILAAEPVAPGPERALVGGETAVAATAPRRVRTVTVRPDGTIVENGAAPAGETPVAAAIAEPPAPIPLALEAIPTPAPAVVEATAAAVTAPAVTPAPALAASRPVVPETPAAAATIKPGDDAPIIVSAIPAPAPRAAPPVIREVATAAPPRQVNTTPARGGPISLMPDVARAPASVPAAAPPVQTAALEPSPAPAAAGGFVVQVSSQRSEEAAMAAFRALQARVPSILGSRSADIQRADLGDRGTFFRARVAPASSRDAATQLCLSLKAAGVDCLVAHN